MNGLHMHDKEFERRVQQKTEGLKITPSEGLWDTIEGQLPAEKKRRPIVFWLFTLLIAGGGIMWWLMGKDRPAANGGPTATLQASTASNQQTDRGDSSQTAFLQKPIQPQLDVQRAGTPTVPHQNTTGAISGPATTNTNEKPNNTVNPQRLAVKGRVRTSQQNGAVATTINETDTPTNRDATVSPQYNTAGQLQTKLTPADIALVPFSDSLAETGELPKLSTPLLTAPFATTHTISPLQTSQGSFIAGAALANNAQQKNKHTSPWQLGITVGAGLSKRNDNLFSTVDERRMEMIANFGSTNGAVFDSLRGKVSKQFRPGPSFQVGLYAQRSIAKRWRLQTGLVYAYLSSRQPARVVYSSAISIGPSNGNGYRIVGNGIYTNQVHLLQMPIALQYKLGSHSKWNLLMGTSLGYVLHSNLLVYPSSGQTPIFLTGKQLYNRLQLMGHFGTAFTPRPASAITIGMRMQYGINTLTKKELDAQRMIDAQIFCQIPFAKK